MAKSMRSVEGMEKGPRKWKTLKENIVDDVSFFLLMSDGISFSGAPTSMGPRRALGISSLQVPSVRGR